MASVLLQDVHVLHLQAASSTCQLHDLLPCGSHLLACCETCQRISLHLAACIWLLPHKSAKGCCRACTSPAFPTPLLLAAALVA